MLRLEKYFGSQVFNNLSPKLILPDEHNLHKFATKFDVGLMQSEIEYENTDWSHFIDSSLSDTKSGIDVKKRKV